jgi:hypothetical protein
MSGRNVPFLKEAALLAAALLLMEHTTLAGEHVRAGDQPSIRSQLAFARVARVVSLPQTVSVVVGTAPQSAPAPVYVDIRGLDGQMRRFPLEGGRTAIQYRQLLLRPGEMLTIRWSPAK